MFRKTNQKLNIAYQHTAMTTLLKAGLFVLVCAYVIAFGLFVGNTQTADAAIPKLINFQGKLTQVSNGNNVANGTYTFEFKLYDDPTAGSLLWTETYDNTPSPDCDELQVTNGVFNTKLGSCNPLTGVDFTTGDLYLSVNFDPGSGFDGEMTPRKQLVSSAFSFVANGVSGDGRVNVTPGQSTTALTVARSGTDYAFQVDTNTASSATGLKVTSAAAAGGIALAAISSGANESLTLDAKGSGSISINGTATGDILLGGGSGSTGCTAANASGNFTCTATITGATINGTSALQYNGTDINTAGTLTNVAYENQANVFTLNQTVQKADPSIILDVTTATDTDFWLGVQDDAGGDDDDVFQIGDGTSVGTNPFLTINTSGNVGIGDTSPASLFTVGSGDLFQINSSGQIGSQQAPVSDYLFALAGTAGNDHSRVIDITQSNNTAEDSRAISIVNTASPPTITGGTREIFNTYSSLAPTVSVTGTSGASELYLYGINNLVNTSSVTLGDSPVGSPTLQTYGNATTTTFSPTLNDTDGGNLTFANAYGTYSNLLGSPTLTNVSGGATMQSYSGYFSNVTSSAGDGSLVNAAYGIYGVSTGNLTTTGTTSHFGGYFETNGSADVNYAIYAVANAPGATANYAAILMGGNVGVGSAAPDRPLEVNSTTGLGVRLTYNDSDGSAANYADLQVGSAGQLNILPSGFISNVGGGATRTALRFLEPSGIGTDYAAIQSNANVTTSYTWTLPAADASGCIQSNGSGTLSISSCGSALTPWTSNIDADGYALQDALNIEFRTAAGSAPAGTVVAVFQDNSGDLTANVLTGKTFNVAVNGTDEYNFSSTALAMNSNNITGIGTALTAAAGVTLSSTSANLALATSTSGNITLAPASTGSVQITSGVSTGTTTSSAVSVVANSLTSGTGLDISSTSLTSGSLLNLLSNGTAAAASQTGLNISLQGTNGTGGITSYGAQISNAHAGGTSTNVALQLSATNGTTANYALITNGGNVGIGDTSPASLFTVGSGDLFQVNSSGQIGSQQAPVSDYLFALAGTTGNDNSRIINITQANNAAEDSTVINIANNAAPASLWGNQMYVKNISATSTPTASLTGSASPVFFNVYGNEQVIDSSTITMSTTGTNSYTYNAYGNAGSVTFNPIVNDASGANAKTANGYGTYSLVAGAPTLTAIGGTTTFNSYSLFGQNTSSSAGNASLTYNSYGLYGEASGNLTATGTTAHYGAYLTVSGTADNNYGLWVDSSGGTNNYAAIFNTGNVGIGSTTPDRKLDVLDASNPQLRLTTTDGSVYSEFQNTANAMAILNGSSFTSSSAVQYGLQITPTINQTSTASYRALDVNVTETAATTANGLNRLADLRVSDSSKFAVSNTGSVTLQNSSYLTTAFGGFGKYENHVVRSEEFDNASWTKTNVTAPTANTQTAPDGSTTAESLATSSSGGDVCQLTGTAPGSNTFTFSVWARSSTGTQNFDMRIDAGATSCATANSTTGTAVTHTATTSWQRFTVTQTFSGASNFVKTRIFPGGTGGSGTVYAWGAQMDMASVPGTYAKTTGAALTNDQNRGLVVNNNLKNTTSSGFLYGGRQINIIDSTTAGTHVGQFIRMVDNTTLNSGQTVRGLEVQAYSGTNVNGVNTGIASFGYTFGIQATTTSQAAAQATPAAIFADLDNGSNATVGNAIRAYSDNATSADLVYVYQETSAYTGNAILVDLGNGGGSFASGNFVNLKNAGTSKFTVGSTGRTDINIANADNTVALYINTEESTTTQDVFVIESDTANGSGADTAKFKITADGSTYNDPGTYTTPADIAEMYNVIGAAESGDVVEIGEAPGFLDGNSYGVKRHEVGSTSAVIGVISTKPGQTLGYQWKRPEVVAQQKPVALAGRVPVKVTNENGYINAGDFLAPSATMSGYAMKATESGVVVGQALESFTGGVGKIEAFVKASNYDGVRIESKIAGLTFDYSNEEVAQDNSSQILEYLLAQLPNLDTANLSQVNTDVVIAGAEIVTPTVTTNTLRADFLTSATTDGGLSVSSTTMFNGGLTVDSISAIGDLLSINSDVEFFGTPYFTTDTAGFALVKEGVQTVDITFGREYLAQPIVNASISFEQDVDQTSLDDEAREILRNEAIAAAQTFLSAPVSYVITNKSKFGFTIVLSQPASRDIKFSWTALAVRNANTFISSDSPENSAPNGDDNGSVAGDSDSGNGSGGLEAGASGGDGGSGDLGDGAGDVGDGSGEIPPEG